MTNTPCKSTCLYSLHLPCPSFPRFFWFFGSLEFPWFFECFPLLFQGFQGFGKSRKSLVFWAFSLVFAKKNQGKEGQGSMHTVDSLAERFSGKYPLGCSSMCWVSWFSGPGFCCCPGFHLHLGASDCSPGLAFCFTGPWTLLGPAARSSPTTRAKTGRTAHVFTAQVRQK